MSKKGKHSMQARSSTLLASVLFFLILVFYFFYFLRGAICCHMWHMSRRL